MCINNFRGFVTLASCVVCCIVDDIITLSGGFEYYEIIESDLFKFYRLVKLWIPVLFVGSEECFGRKTYLLVFLETKILDLGVRYWSATPSVSVCLVVYLLTQFGSRFVICFICDLFIDLIMIVPYFDYATIVFIYLW